LICSELGRLRLGNLDDKEGGGVGPRCCVQDGIAAAAAEAREVWPTAPDQISDRKRRGARDAGTRGQAWTRGGEAGDWDGAMMRKKSGLVGPRGVLGP
jgi:hypothetical protein